MSLPGFFLPLLSASSWAKTAFCCSYSSNPAGRGKCVSTVPSPLGQRLFLLLRNGNFIHRLVLKLRAGSMDNIELPYFHSDMLGMEIGIVHNAFYQSFR